MKNRVKIPFAILSIALLSACNLESTPDSTILMTAINYTENSRITYHENDNYITPKGTIIAPGDYKPVWSAIQNRLHISLLEHQAAATTAEKKSVSYFRDNWPVKPYADVTMGTVAAITNYSVSGNKETILDLKPYIEKTKFIPDPKNPEEETYDPNNPGPLPNIALFIHKNPGVQMSIMTAKHSHPDKGAFYFVPYFNGFDDIERATMVRADYVYRLLDDDVDDTFSSDTKVLGKEGEAKYSQHYTPYYLKEGTDMAPTYQIPVPDEESDNGISYITKKETKNIISRQNDLINKGEASSMTLVNQFKVYLNDRYGKNEETGYPFGKHSSDLFLGNKACYDADELVALMRIAKVSPKSIFGTKETKEMVPWMPRQCDNMRSSDLYRWAGQLFGVRGTDSRYLYLYLNGEIKYPEIGDKEFLKVHDCRGDEAMLNMIKKLHEMYQEGLILQDFDTPTATGTTSGKFADDTFIKGGNDYYTGLLHFDIIQDQTTLNDKSEGWVTPQPDPNGHPYKITPMIGAVAKWDVDPNESDPIKRYQWMQFTESWSSVKTSAVCLNANLKKNPTKLKAAFDFLDYIYSPEGKFLYNYGPYEEGYITELAGKAKLDDPSAKKNVDYIEYRGERIPQYTTKALQQFKEKDSLLRRYVGATIPMGFIKLNGMDYESFHPNTKDGVMKINRAIEAGTYKHPLIGPTTGEANDPYNKGFYRIVPTSFFLTKGQASLIADLLNKNTLGSMFTDSSTNTFNIWDSYVMGKESKIAPPLNQYLETVNGKWKLPTFVAYHQDAYEIITA